MILNKKQLLELSLKECQGKKIGVVLSGGGAKGAYEVGFLKALSECNIQPQAIAGTSIGALNGTLYSALQDTHQAYQTLKKIWNGFKKDSPLKLDKTKSFLHLVDFAIPFFTSNNHALKSFSTSLSANKGILQLEPLLDLLRTYAPISQIQSGLPLYVSMSEANQTFQDVCYGLDLNKVLPMKKVKTHYVKIQDCLEDQIYPTILASSSLPLLFDAQQIDGKFYRDGGLGVNDNPYANTPIPPLVEKEKCDLIFVCHLDSNISHQFLHSTKARIVEVIPPKEIFSSILNPLQFGKKQIEAWMKQGYVDTLETLKQFFYDPTQFQKALEARHLNNAFNKSLQKEVLTWLQNKLQTT